MKPDPTATEQPPVDLRTDQPHPARVYDYLLGGRDNFPADREAADRSLAAFPHANTPPERIGGSAKSCQLPCDRGGHPTVPRIGSGLPTSPIVHRSPGRESRDPSVYVTTTDRACSGTGVADQFAEGKTMYIDADAHDPDKIFEQAQEVLNFGQPVGLLLLSIIHFVRDDEDPYALVRRYLDKLPPGSYLAMSHLTGEFDRPTWQYISSQYDGTAHTMVCRSGDRRRFFDGWSC